MDLLGKKREKEKKNEKVGGKGERERACLSERVCVCESGTLASSSVARAVEWFCGALANRLNISRTGKVRRLGISHLHVTYLT